MFSDHINCTSSGDETYILKGTVDPATEMVSLDYCNNDNFIGAGSVSYAGGRITGSVRCISKYSNQMRLNIP